MTTKNLMWEVIKRIDLTENVFVHPVAKLFWVAANICLATMAIEEIGPLFAMPSLGVFEPVGWGLFVALVYPKFLKYVAWGTSRRRLALSVIPRAPGGWLVTALKFLFTKRAFDRIFSQVLMDGREEYWEALSKGGKWLARWRWVQLYLSLVIAIVTWIGVSFLKKAIKMWKAG